MYTYILITLLSLVVIGCIKKSFPNHFIGICGLLIGAFLCAVINLVYFGVNYNTLPTKTVSKVIESVPDSELKISIEKDTLIKIETPERIFEIEPKEFVNINKGKDSLNIVNSHSVKYIDINEWLMISSFPERAAYKTINLTDKCYDLFKTCQDSISKRKDILSKNG